MTDYPARLLLVRHGETNWNAQNLPQGHIDIPLNENGRQQAHALAVRLRDTEIHAVYSSDLVRAAETAAILGTVLGLAPRLSAAWREMDLGAWSGLSRAEIEERFPNELAALDQGVDVPRGGGENMAAVQIRVIPAFEQLRGAHPGQNVLLVSHGGALKALIGHLIGLELSHYNRLSVGCNTGLSIIEFGWGRPQLTLLNDISHLDGKNGASGR